MHFITLFLASFAVVNTVAAPSKASIQPFTESEGKLEFNSAIYTTENFTASDGKSYEIVWQPPFPDPYTPDIIGNAAQYC